MTTVDKTPGMKPGLNFGSVCGRNLSKSIETKMPRNPTAIMPSEMNNANQCGRLKLMAA